MFNNPDFYPTPTRVIDKMLSGIDFKLINTVLEPSAGKGNIVETIINKLKYSHSYSYNKDIKWDIDTVEKDENLQHILKGKGYRIIHNDFLNMETYKHYDLIVMNPPFSEGDKHLLKAIEMQERAGGKIVCLLNAETLNNPYSNIRKDLQRKLEDHHAKVEFISNAFADAERSSCVEVALIKIDIPKKKNNSFIINELKQQEFLNQQQHTEQHNNYIVDSDYIKRIVAQYNFEVKAGLKLIEEYEALKPFMLNTFKEDKYSKEPVLLLTISDRNANKNELLSNAYIKQIRAKYWEALFMSDEFMGLFTTNLRQKYYNQIGELEDYDFSLYNIYTIRIQLNQEMIKGVEDTILDLFDEFSHKYHWYNETSKNIHYFNGWKTNECWKINKKVIVPLQGFRDLEYSWGGFKPTYYDVVNKLTDIEKVFNYLQAGTDIEVEDIDLKQTLELAEHYGDSKKIKTKYITIDFYKKGTAHFYFNNEELLHRLNIFGSQSKNWLPPSYGKKTYNEMDEEERQVIDSFEGEMSYKKVMNNQKDYILETNQLLALA